MLLLTVIRMLPVRWSLLIFQYSFYWLQHEADRRPLLERAEAVLHMAMTFSILMIAYDRGSLWIPTLYWVIPSCLANTMLA